MVSSQYYNWIDFYYLNDSLWIENVLNWEYFDNFGLIDIFWYDIIFNYNQTSSNFFFKNYNYLSYIDVFFLLLYKNNIYILYNSFILDLYNSFNNLYINFNFLYIYNYLNSSTLYLYYNPELMLSLYNYYLNYIDINFNYNIKLYYNMFSNNNNFLLLDTFNYIKIFFFNIALIFIFFNIINIIKFKNSLSFFITKLFLYFYSLSKDLRIQFELMVSLIIFILFIYIFMIISYNDNQVEYIELINSNIFLFFLFIILFFLYKYSIHYFSFLEASITEGKSILFIMQQFVRDISNTFALFLRFFLLFFRLNVYDGLDDILDSYYIFFCDFDNDNYYEELLVPLDSIIYNFKDNSLDSNFINNLENDTIFDFFQKYYIIWGKFFMFWAFILEIVFRLTLAIYIMYLIIFEVHSVNSSYFEDNYFSKKK